MVGYLARQAASTAPFVSSSVWASPACFDTQSASIRLNLLAPACLRTPSGADQPCARMLFGIQGVMQTTKALTDRVTLSVFFTPMTQPPLPP